MRGRVKRVALQLYRLGVLVAIVWLICTAIMVGMILGRYYIRIR